MHDVFDLLTNELSPITLDQAALDIAGIEYPDLDPDPWFRVLDEIAFTIADRTGDLSDNRKFVEVANTHLFRTVGLRGNETDYYDIRNSCLNDVLDRRVGIPITLSVVYLEVCRRLAKPLFGIGLPGHFIVQFDDGDLSVYIDPFHGGRFLSMAECERLIVEGAGRAPHPSMFTPVTSRQIALRMLQNMKAIYVSSEAYEKAIQVFDLILASGASGVEEYKQRAVVNLRAGRFRAAAADLETYLAVSPNAADRTDVLAQIDAIHRRLTALN